MANGTKKISLAVFGIIILCFLLPFVDVSCQKEKVASFSGIQLVTGTTIEAPDTDMFGGSRRQKATPEPWAILAFLCGVSGFIFSLMRKEVNNLLCTYAGTIGVVTLVILNSKIKHDVLKEGRGMFQVEFGIGYYLSIILFLVAVGINIYSLAQSKRASPVQSSKKERQKFCAKCGAKNSQENEFCTACGNKFL